MAEIKSDVADAIWRSSDAYKEAERLQYERLREEMFSGPVGEILRLIAEESEAAPPADAGRLPT